jgi:outer membrane protein assembly factor BamB
MKTSHLTSIVPALLAFVGVVLLILWTSMAPSSQFAVRVPGLDDTPRTAAASDERELVAGQPISGPGIALDVTCDWPGFRGPRRDAICEAGAPLIRQLPPGGPPVLWQVDVEEGFAGAAVRSGRVFVLDYDKQAQADTLRCLSLSDGREIWRNSYPVSISPNHGITRTVPALHDDVVVTIGPRCHVAGWDMETGRNRWLFSMVQRYGSEERQWYTGQCPLVDGDRVILAPCGPDSLLVALDYRTGEEIWRTPNPRGWKMTHSSVMPVEFAGQRMYVYCGTGGTAGVSAEDGRLLWDETSWTESFATSPSPLAVPDGRIFLSSGYDVVGAMWLQLKQQGDSIVAEAAGKLDRKQFNSEQQTPIFYQGHLYGIRKFRGGQFVCLDLQGNEIWNSGQDKFGHGPYVIADGLLLIFGDDGVLVAAEATPEAYRPLWRLAVYDKGHEAWGPLAIASGRLILRDMTRMTCLDLRRTGD